MTSLFTARRRAEEFAALVDGDHLDNRDDADLADLVSVVATLRTHDAAPRPEFTSELRIRLMAQADTALSPQSANLLLPVRHRGARERRLVAAASAVVFIGGTTSIAAASQDSLPGDALYPIKRGIERAEAGLSLDDAGKGEDLLTHAQARLTEVDGLLADSSVPSEPQVPETLVEFSAQADEGAELLFGSFEQSNDPESVRTVRLFTTNAITELAQLADEVPADAQQELGAAALALRNIDDQATSLCDSCLSDLPAVDVPDFLLAQAEVNRALASINASTLDNSHPVVVPKGAVEKQEDAPSEARPKDPDVGGSQQQGPTSGPSQTPRKVPANPALPEPPLAPSLQGQDEPATGPATGGKPPADKPALPAKPPKKPDRLLGGAVVTLLPEPDGNKLLP
ncbi:MAG TPA: DUF5667 domain-containing protein [Nocardioidaceae bacterium]|nr:DUF5667 domain-containing protein [Nocardioidaceae bacterium]